MYMLYIYIYIFICLFIVCPLRALPGRRARPRRSSGGESGTAGDKE